MDAERWQRLSPLLDALLELDPETRARSLALTREEDPRLADELEALLLLDDDNADFLSQPLLAPIPGPRPDAMVGPYRLQHLLGEGGMGQVWMAARADGLYQRRVALKLLRPGLADPNLRLRFTRERQILARLEHPHIARLLDAGISGDGQPYLALEYVEGEPITDWCRARQFGLEARLALFLQICDAVSHAHANLIVHRDLKPSNILVTALDEVRLLDFGIAKLLDSGELAPDHTRTGLRTFTLHYAAPEQIRGEPVTTMTDVYSLGVVLYELLTDAKPYRLKRQTDAEWEEAILAMDPLRPSATLQRSADADDDRDRAHALRRRARVLLGDLDNIVLKALAKRPEQRYPSVEALSLDLQRYRDGKPVQARPQSLGYRLRKYLHRHRWALATAALVTAVLSIALGIVAWQAQQALREAGRAQAMQDFVVGLFEQAGGASTREPLDVRSLLDAGVERGSRELARQPLARAELYGVIARLRLGLGDYPQAMTLLQRQRAIVDALAEVPTGLRLGSITDLGNAQRLLGRPAECIASMGPHEALVRREQDQLPLRASEFYSQLGRCRRELGQRETARVLFQRSLALRRAPLADAAGEVENLADLAGLQSDAGNTHAALRGYRQALAQLQAKIGPRHPLAIELQRSLCSLERMAGLLASAELDCRNALALALDIRGREHPATVDARRQLAAIHVDQGRFREAEAAFRESRIWHVARLGEQHEDVARDDNSLGIVAWERGDLAAALAALERSVSTLRRQPHSTLLPGVLFNHAMVLHATSQDRAALALLQEARALRAERLGRAHPLVGDTDRLLGEVQAALGRHPQALESLQSAVRLTRAGYGRAHPHTRRAELSLALYEAGRGDHGAVARLQALAGLPRHDQELRKVAWLAAAAVAASQCAHNRLAALLEFAAIEREMQAALPEAGVLAREVAALRADCR